MKRKYPFTTVVVHATDAHRWGTSPERFPAHCAYCIRLAPRQWIEEARDARSHARDNRLHVCPGGARGGAQNRTCHGKHGYTNAACVVAGAITHAPATPYQRIALRSVKGAADARLHLPLTLATRFPDKGPRKLDGGSKFNRRGHLKAQAPAPPISRATRRP